MVCSVNFGLNNIYFKYCYILVSDQFWSNTSFGHICFKMFVDKKKKSFTVTSLEVPVYSGVRKQ